MCSPSRGQAARRPGRKAPEAKANLHVSGGECLGVCLKGAGKPAPQAGRVRSGMEARPAKRRGSAAGGRPAWRRLARAIRQNVFSFTGAGGPGAPGRPAPGAKANFHTPGGISGGMPEAVQVSRRLGPAVFGRA
jgi:hypothetical protein